MTRSDAACRDRDNKDGAKCRTQLLILLLLANLVMLAMNSGRKSLLLISSEAPHNRISIGLEFKGARVPPCADTGAGVVGVHTSTTKEQQQQQQQQKDEVLEEVSLSVMPERRRKLHLCRNPTRSKHGYHILKEEFGFEHIDATEDGQEWDVIFGGYPNCGTVKQDVKMKTGLNKQLLEQGFDSLKPHQVYFPCMGCTQTYCNKEKLCRLQRSIDPDSCYLLPDDLDLVKQRMRESKNATWVLKHDSLERAVHSGQGVQIVNSVSQLPSRKELKKSSFLVQPFIDSYLGQGDWRRKTEVRYYVAITSVNPLRVYYFNDQWMPLSSTLWVDDPPSSLYKRCMQDSHAYKASCRSVATRVKGEKRVRFTDYQKATGMPTSVVEKFHKEATEMMTKIFTKSLPVMQGNSINQGITKSGASCFSFMRADFGITSDGRAYLYEINELPYGKEPRIAGEVQKAAYRDLFTMIGIAHTPLPVDKRAEYEARHQGNWTLLPTTSEMDVE